MNMLSDTILFRRGLLRMKAQAAALFLKGKSRKKILAPTAQLGHPLTTAWILVTAIQRDT